MTDLNQIELKTVKTFLNLCEEYININTNIDRFSFENFINFFKVNKFIGLTEILNHLLHFPIFSKLVQINNENLLKMDFNQVE